MSTEPRGNCCRSSCIKLSLCAACDRPAQVATYVPATYANGISLASFALFLLCQCRTWHISQSEASGHNSSPFLLVDLWIGLERVQTIRDDIPQQPVRVRRVSSVQRHCMLTLLDSRPRSSPQDTAHTAPIAHHADPFQPVPRHCVIDPTCKHASLLKRVGTTQGCTPRLCVFIFSGDRSQR